MTVSINIDQWLFPIDKAHSFKFGTNLSAPDFSSNKDDEHYLPHYQYICTALFLIIRILLFFKMSDKLRGLAYFKKNTKEHENTKSPNTSNIA